MEAFSLYYQSQVSILGPVGYGPTTLPLRHSDLLIYNWRSIYLFINRKFCALGTWSETEPRPKMMASTPCNTIQLTLARIPNSSTSPSSCGSTRLSCQFLGTRKRLTWFRPSGVGPSSCGSRATCWFKFGKNGVDAEGAGIYGSQSREDFDRDDVEQSIQECFEWISEDISLIREESRREQFTNISYTLIIFCVTVMGRSRMRIEIPGSGKYFNYMGMLAVEGTYDKMNALLSQNIHPVDILLMMAASEGDKPKIEELLRAGAKYTVQDSDGRTALDRAASEEIRDFILEFSVKKA
ncbi:hypothetical protein RJ639_039433 [Escallonia herrerae]|uniref:Protein LHCP TRANSLOCATION DEFECT n=1 Tax=Escallonia herrerae TaxID=1293975 RepID=A0AA88WHH1_9ASTE|nr:hypothetical protein RJ639_039433 [Escallonia herrerae]